MEGVEKSKVRLLPHNPEWDIEFLKVSAELQKIWNNNILDIQHVGSTAIKAIYAKPILDIAVQLKSIDEMDIARLTNIGYDHRGAQFGNPNYHLFVLKGENQISFRHIHCYNKDVNFRSTWVHAKCLSDLLHPAPVCPLETGLSSKSPV